VDERAARSEVAGIRRVRDPHELGVAPELLGARTQSRRERELVRPKRQDEDVVAVQAAHPIVREARRETGIRGRGVDGAEAATQGREAGADVCPPRERGVEPLGMAEVLEDEDAFCLVEAQDLRAHGLG
jgi:hypothetical protein